MCLKPLQVRNLAYSKSMRPQCLASGESSTYSPLRPQFLGSFRRNGEEHGESGGRVDGKDARGHRRTEPQLLDQATREPDGGG